MSNTHVENARAALAELDSWEQNSQGLSGTGLLLRCIAESTLGLLELSLEVHP